MAAPSALFGNDGEDFETGLDAGIARLCAGCPRYHHCGLWLDAWIRPADDVPAPKRRGMPSHLYPAGATTDRNGLPLGRYGPDGRVQVGGRAAYHGR